MLRADDALAESQGHFKQAILAGVEDHFHLAETVLTRGAAFREPHCCC